MKRWPNQPSQGGLDQYNAVRVRVQRNSSLNGQVRLFFGGIFGTGSADVSAEAIAGFRDGIEGFRANEHSGNSKLLPFAIDVDDNGKWQEWCCEAALGAHRLIRGQSVTTPRVRFRVVEAPVCPAISELGLFYDKQTAKQSIAQKMR